MTLVDRTNEEIDLTIERPAGVVLKLDVDQDSSFIPASWIWLEVEHTLEDDVGSKAWRLTHEEAGLAHDRLGLILGRVSSHERSRQAIQWLSDTDHHSAAVGLDAHLGHLDGLDK